VEGRFASRTRIMNAFQIYGPDVTVARLLTEVPAKVLNDLFERSNVTR
jgi:hypothetical protein